jgi:CysZ protein
MNAVGRALGRALPLMIEPRVLGVVLAPLATAVALFAALAYLFWAPLGAAMADMLAHGARALGVTADLAWLATAGGGVAAFVLLALAAGVFALAAIAVLAGPVFTRVVASRRFPQLERNYGGTVAGGVANAAATIALWLPMWLVTLPFLLVPIVGIPLSLCLNAWFNQRLFRYDALAEHASAVERAAVVRGARGRLFALGLVLAPLAFVPIVNLFAPLYAGLAFTHLCLDELAALRARGGPGVA